MGDVLPPRRQTVVDRLRRRIELYRRHHNVCLPIHENSTNGLNEQHRRDTLLLRQKFLEAKAKKAKKNEHRSVKEATSDAAKIIPHPKPVKATTDSSPAIATPEVIADESANVPSTETNTTDQPVHDQPAMPSFSVQIVQQFTNSNSSQVQNPQTIQTNVTVKALSGAAAKCNSPLSVTAAHQKDSQQQQQKSQPASQLPQPLQPQAQQQPQPSQPQEQTLPTGDTSCDSKQEKEVGCTSDLCERKKTSSSIGSGGRLSDTFPSLGFAEDSSDDVIHPDILKDLIDDVFTNSADLMKDFNFEDSVGSVKDQDEIDKDADASMLDLVKGSSSPQLQSFPNGNGVFENQSSSAQQGMELFPREAVSSTNSMTVLTATTTITTPTTTGLYPPPVRLPTYNNHNGSALNISSGLGLDFKLTEPSPAALTLKQMAEQHQNMQQKHQHLNLRIASPSNASGRTQCSQDGFSDHLSSIRSGFINGTANNPNNISSFSKGPSHNVIFNSVAAFDPPYPGVEPLRNVFKQEVCLTNMGNHLSDASLQSQQALHMSQMPGRPGSIAALKSPAYGSTRPLTHYPDPLEQNVNRAISGQYSSSVPMDSRIQMSQNMHIGHNNPQLAQVHSASSDVKQQQSPSMQNSSNLYSNFASHLTNSPVFHPSISQSLPYTSQFGPASGLSRPPPEYKANQPDMASSVIPMADHQNSDPSSRLLYSSTKNGFPSQHQRPPNVTINPDRFGLPTRPSEWRHGLIHPHHNAIRMDGYPHQDGYNAMMSENPHLSVMSRPPLHPQYRLIGPQMDGGRIPRQQLVPGTGQTVMHQRQQVALHAQPVSQPLPSSGMDLQAVSPLPVGNGASSQTSVPNQIYCHPDITRQEGHHINLDFLDNFESIASDFLNFDQGNGANFPLLDDVEMLSK